MGGGGGGKVHGGPLLARGHGGCSRPGACEIGAALVIFLWRPVSNNMVSLSIPLWFRLLQAAPIGWRRFSSMLKPRIVLAVVLLGRNEVYVKMGWLLVPRIEINFYDISDNKKTSKKYFLVRRSGEEIAVELGFRPPNVSSYFNVSSEINADAAKISRVELDRTLKAITLKESPPIQLAPNTEKFVEDSMTLSHEVKTSTTWTVGADLKAQVNAAWAAVTVGILGKLESVTSSDYSVETKRTRSVTIKGGSPPVKVVWVEYFRTGTAIVAINGREVRVPFEIDEDFDLVTEPAR